MLFYRSVIFDSSLDDVQLNIILMHGLFGESSNLMNLAQMLSEQLKANVFSVDMLNHGASPHTTDMSYPSMAESVESLLSIVPELNTGLSTELDKDLNKLDSKPIVLIGHSMGGKVAMQMAARQVYSYSAVVIADIAPVDYSLVHLPIIAALKDVDQSFSENTITQRKQAESILANTIEEPALRQFLLKNLKRDVNKRWHWQFGLSEIELCYPELARQPMFEQGSRFNNPCLIIKGGASNYISTDSQEAFELRFSQIDFKVIDGAGHWLHAEKPKLFVSLIARFIKQNVLE